MARNVPLRWDGCFQHLYEAGHPVIQGCAAWAEKKNFNTTVFNHTTV